MTDEKKIGKIEIYQINIYVRNGTLRKCRVSFHIFFGKTMLIYIKKEGNLLDELKTVNCEQLMTTPLKPIEFCVDGIISTGLFVLAGAPKVGKSWLALDMALSISKGEEFLYRETKRGTALYLCLEDSYTRI